MPNAGTLPVCFLSIPEAAENEALGVLGELASIINEDVLPVIAFPAIFHQSIHEKIFPTIAVKHVLLSIDSAVISRPTLLKDNSQDNSY